MLSTHQVHKHKSNSEAIREDSNDLPPAYDALSLHWHPSTSHDVDQVASAPRPEPRNDLRNSDPGPPVFKLNKTLPPPPRIEGASFTRENARHASTERSRPRKNASWLSLLPFASSFSAKRVRQSVSSTVADLVVPPRTGNQGQKNAHEVLASAAETCAEHKISFSGILQETFVADHTPMYWAIVHYREELLVALLSYAGPLSVDTSSDVRRACLAGSNQGLFHALRVCRPPFHRTNGIQVPSLRTASDNLLLGDRPLDEIHIQCLSGKMLVVSLDIPLWQTRMKTIGRVSVEFIASGRMWSVTFFCTDPSLPVATSGKRRKGANTWHVMVSLLESSPPTFFDSQFVVDVPSPSVAETTQSKRLREARSTTFPSSGDHARSSRYDPNHSGKARLRSLSAEDGRPCSSSFSLPPPVYPLRRSPSQQPPIAVHLGCGHRKLACRSGTREPAETRTTAETWSDHGVGYTNAAVASLEQGLACQLFNDRSPYLLPDGTLRGRLEARFEKTEMNKDCIVC